MVNQQAEAQLRQQILDVLADFDELTVQTNVPLRHAGVLADVLARTTNKLIVIEGAVIADAETLQMAINKAQHVRRATGAQSVIVVVDAIPDDAGELPAGTVYATATLAEAVTDILAQPVFRGSADVCADEDASFVYVAMPYRLGFDEAYYLGVVDAAIKAGLVVDRPLRSLDLEDDADIVAESVANCTGVVIDHSGSDDMVKAQQAIVNETDKPVVNITRDDPPEELDDVITYSLNKVDALRDRLVDAFKAMLA
ncbi:MAG: hypothetical protein ACFB51_13210 [Anaerolineae bacterium]